MQGLALLWAEVEFQQAGEFWRVDENPEENVSTDFSTRFLAYLCDSSAVAYAVHQLCWSRISAFCLARVDRIGLVLTISIQVGTQFKLVPWSRACFLAFRWRTRENSFECYNVDNCTTLNFFAGINVDFSVVTCCHIDVFFAQLAKLIRWRDYFGSLLVDRCLVVTGDGSEIGDMSGGFM